MAYCSRWAIATEQVANQAFGMDAFVLIGNNLAIWTFPMASWLTTLLSALEPLLLSWNFHVAMRSLILGALMAAMLN